MEDHSKMAHAKSMSPYGRFALMIGLSFLAMYVLMYAMVNALPNAIPNYNQFYMAGLMTAPMVILEMILMGAMYPEKKLNSIIAAIGVGLLIIFWMLIRYQIAISDRQFLKSMIPHHAGAILMCDNASLSDLEIKQLCAGIVSSQRGEIDFMKRKLEQK